MVKLYAGEHGSIAVEPRRGKQSVRLSSQALEALSIAQAQLPSDLKLILTRGFERQGVGLRLLRIAGKGLFCCLYPSRAAEAAQIFYHNGHAQDGNHIDVGVRVNDREVDLLPAGVFTSVSQLTGSELRHSRILSLVSGALRSAGFTIHPNRTEALQIHCDYLPHS